MAKYIIETIQTVKRTYYVEVDDPTWAHDGIVMGELEEFAQGFYTEDIISTRAVEEWPKLPRALVNGAVMVFDKERDKWTEEVRWDLAE